MGSREASSSRQARTACCARSIATATTSGKLDFAGETTGDFIALDATSGKLLYRFNAGRGIGGGIVTYGLGGKQYVAVASGPPGLNFVRDNPGTPTLFVFALP
jgi:hypothetical protein